MSTSSPLGSSPSTINRHFSSSNRPGQRTYKRYSKTASSRTVKRADDSPLETDESTEEDGEGVEHGDEDDAENILKRKRQETLGRSPALEIPSSPLSDLPPSPSRPSRSKSKPSSTILPIKRAITPPPAIRHSKSPTTPKHLLRPHRILSPQGSPKDLSALFAETAGAGSPAASSLGEGSQGTPSKRRRARTMLSKAQSMGAASFVPVVEGGPVDGAGHFTSYNPAPSAGPSTPSKSLRKTVSETITSNEHEDVLEPNLPKTAAIFGLPPPLEQPRSGGRATRTYGRTRTMLAPQAMDSLTDSDFSLAESLDATHAAQDQIKESYAELRSKYEVDNDMDEEAAARNIYASLEIAKAPSTITDMRSKGENRRFMDEICYLTEGIRDPATSISVKRASSIDVLHNMVDSEWLDKMSICGQVDRIWEAFLAARGEGQSADEVMTAVCLVFVALLITLQPPISTFIQSQSGHIIEIAASQLRQRDGPLDGGAKVKKGPMRSSANRLRNLCEETEGLPYSTRGIASLVIAHMCTSDSLESSLDTIAQHRVLHRSLRALCSETQILSQRFDLHENGLDLITEEVDFSIQHINDVLSIINRLYVFGTDNEALHGINIADSMADGLIIALHLLVGENSRPAARVITELLKLYVGYSTASRSSTPIRLSPTGYLALMRVLLLRGSIVCANADAVAVEVEGPNDLQPGGANDMRDEEGLITTGDIMGSILVVLRAAIADEGVKESLESAHLSKTCKMQRACLRQCRCKDTIPAADHLIDIFQHLQNHDHDPMAAVLAGNLGLLIAVILPLTDEQKCEHPTELLEALQRSLETLQRMEATASSRVGGTEEEESDIAVAVRRVEAKLVEAI